MRLFAGIALGTMAVACATHGRQPTQSMHLLAGLFTGSEASMARFEAAARQCGAQVFSIERPGEPRWIGIGRGLAAPAGDPRIECAMNWIVNHPDEELYFVGNESRD